MLFGSSSEKNSMFITHSEFSGVALAHCTNSPYLQYLSSIKSNMQSVLSLEAYGSPTCVKLVRGNHFLEINEI